MSFREDGRSRNRDAARIPFDERFLLDEDVELHGIDEQIVGRDGELLERGGHCLAAGLVDVPRVDARGIDLSDRPGDSVLANSERQFFAAFGGEFF